MKTEGIIVFGLIGLGLLLLLATRSNPGFTRTRPLVLKPFSSSAKPVGKRYQNTETWEIKWNTDGLPEKVTIHRDAVRS